MIIWIKKMNFKIFSACCVLGIFVSSCTCRKSEIKHLPFFDGLSNSYLTEDTVKAHPLFNQNNGIFD